MIMTLCQKELNKQQIKHILGTQAICGRVCTTTQHVEYMVYPRMLALRQKVVWSLKKIKTGTVLMNSFNLISEL